MKAVVEAHRGRLSATSDPASRGAAFSIPAPRAAGTSTLVFLALGLVAPLFVRGRVTGGTEATRPVLVAQGGEARAALPGGVQDGTSISRLS